jgi:hypothetical protein
MVTKSALRLLFFMLFNSIGSIAFSQTLQGKVIDGKTKQPISFAIMTLTSNHQQKQTEMADEKGYFRFVNLKPDHYSINFTAVGYDDTTFLVSAQNNDTIINLVYFKFCQYDESLRNKTCPVCHKKNMSIPIVYGLPYSSKGKDPTKGNEKKFLLAGCEISYCDPHWYCKRDKIKF